MLPPKTLRTIALNLGGRPSSRRCSGKPSRSPRSRGPSLRLSRSGRRADHRDCQPAINATDDRCGADRPPSRNCCSLAPAKSAASYAAHARANARACSVGKDRSAAVTTSRVCLPPSSFANASSHCFSYEEAQRAGIAHARPMGTRGPIMAESQATPASGSRVLGKTASVGRSWGLQ